MHARMTPGRHAHANIKNLAHGHHTPALDGLRALSILAVLLYHAGVAWAGGGFVGVEVFFVLSGFLITRPLVSECRRSGTIALRAFWAGVRGDCRPPCSCWSR